MLFKKIQRDKWKHFFVGIGMGIFLQAIAFWLFHEHIGFATVIVLVIVIAISYGFELFSKITGWGRYDIYDAIASILGGVLGMIIVFLLD